MIVSLIMRKIFCLSRRMVRHHACALLPPPPPSVYLCEFDFLVDNLVLIIMFYEDLQLFLLVGIFGLYHDLGGGKS